MRSIEPDFGRLRRLPVPCRIERRGAGRGVPRSPTPRAPLPAQEKAERCERAQSVPARPAGRYAEPPAAALRPLSSDENSRNPAHGRRDADFSDALHRQRKAPARFTSRRRVPRAARPSAGVASLRYASRPTKPHNSRHATQRPGLQPRFVQLTLASISSRYKHESSSYRGRPLTSGQPCLTRGDTIFFTPAASASSGHAMPTVRPVPENGATSTRWSRCRLLLYRGKKATKSG